MKHSLVYSLVSQIYIALIGIIFMPVYLHRMGAEAFGLIGLFIMAQAWIQVLDMGFTPVLSRDIARFRAGSVTVYEAASRLRVLEWLFTVFILVIISIVACFKYSIVQHWIHARTIDTVTLTQCLVLIAAAVSLRWFAGLYRGVLVGQERQTRVNLLQAGFATLRFVGVIPLIFFFSPTVTLFFGYQVLVSAVELFSSRLIAMSEIPRVTVRPSFSTFKSMLPMVGGMAFLNLVWIFFTQIDKLILSGILNLQNFGYFTLAVVAASGILMMMSPLSQVVQPRLNYLIAQGDEEMLKTLYGLASQFAVVGFTGIGAGLAFFAEPALKIWAGNAEIAHLSAPILFWYGLGNAAVGMMLAPFMLQFSRGNLRLHIYIHAVLVVILVPMFFYAAHTEGGVGTGKVYLAVNGFFLLLWSPVVHRYFMPSLTWQWLLRDTLPVSALMMVVLYYGSAVMPNNMTVLATLVWMAGVVLFAMLVGIMFGAHTRRFIAQQMGVLK